MVICTPGVPAAFFVFCCCTGNSRDREVRELSSTSPEGGMEAGSFCLVPRLRSVRSHRRRYCTSSMLSQWCALLAVHALGRATAFMLPTSTCESYSGESRSSYGRSSAAAMRLLGGDASGRPKGGLFSRVRTTTSPVSSSVVDGDTSMASSSSSSSGKSAPGPVVYAQEALDRAWRSKRRIAAQGKSNPLKQRFMNAFGGRSAVFVDDRDFMEETLDNVVRVRQRLHYCC